ncbi:MAG: bifunctional DNA-formamidopyrimidine glycosylase/DNA-(apurinic or apyrimidinic site) lyase [Geminicoccaceae bacterium]|nr:bifunctional DNA-formamidopyrimidine glycosylase/DNA-(apurinic or apyrimidinic site) lyase [Geminicoccaceae bacterium]MCX8099996.1 bifunctional DNA-formamidopyrimidine glycosylase/DNA-(apurinic or apyrimidinic site) lyase [Geminicoccaceae bacterium]MDW8369786.1 bifunctional DNA-formamidopyrimidine glycosylase/DNA-(apurinic or apyrimidinic site) lyase [Geminicoccaceae bacterium]
MPELPEVETITRGLAARLSGRRIVALEQRRPDLRFPLPERLAARLEGRRVEAFARRGKFILATLDDGWTLLLHLGMSGRLVLDGAPRGPHEHLTFRFEDGSTLRFVDPRRFGMLDLWPHERLAEHPQLRALGVEPLAPEFDGPRLEGLLRGRRTPLKSALMDQRLLVGIGNIYANEALFRARLSPRRLAGSIGPTRAARLVRAIRETLEAAIAKGGTSLRDYVQANGELGNFQNDFAVYERAGAPCPACGRPIRRIVQAGRATYFCPRCQR